MGRKEDEYIHAHWDSTSDKVKDTYINQRAVVRMVRVACLSLVTMTVVCIPLCQNCNETEVVMSRDSMAERMHEQCVEPCTPEEKEYKKLVGSEGRSLCVNECGAAVERTLRANSRRQETP